MCIEGGPSFFPPFVHVLVFMLCHTGGGGDGVHGEKGEQEKATRKRAVNNTQRKRNTTKV